MQMKAMDEVLFIMPFRTDEKRNTTGVYYLGCLVLCDFLYSGTRHEKNMKDGSFESYFIGTIYRAN